MVTVQAGVLAVCEEVEEEEKNSRRGRKARRRIRSSVAEVYECMGPTLFRRYYRMTYKSFWILHDKLGDSIELCTKLVKGWKPSV
jgi:hypothetical protein